MKSVRVLMLGDIVGAAGRKIFQRHIARIKQEHNIDGIIINGENSAHGVGITPHIVEFFKQHQVDVITSGNHVWHKKDIYPYIASHHDLLRPANYPSGVPGVGATTFLCKGQTIGVINLQGLIFMREDLECPFRTAETVLTWLRNKTKLIFVDFHAEATSEKLALATYLDGKISALVGTHTHVQTADERIMPKGTACICDAGMSGAVNSLLGMESEPIIHRFLTQMPVRFSVEMRPPYKLEGVIIEADIQSGLAQSIKRLQIIDTDIDGDVDDVATLGGW